MWQQHGNDPKTSMPCLVLSLALNRLQSDMLPAGQHNDLATAMLSSPVDTVKRIFSLGHEQSADICAGHSPCYFTLRSLAVLFPTFLILMALTGGLYGISVASATGCPAPSLQCMVERGCTHSALRARRQADTSWVPVQVGASFGATCGLILMRLLPSWRIQPGLYALFAATALLGGVFRASISLVCPSCCPLQWH